MAAASPEDLLRFLITLLHRRDPATAGVPPTALEQLAAARVWLAPPPAKPRITLAAMTAEAQRMRGRRAAELQWRNAAALERLCQEERRQRDHLVSQRAVALHGVLAKQRKEKDAVLVHRRKQHSGLETEFLEGVAMASHDLYASTPGAAACGFVPVGRWAQLLALWQEAQAAAARRHDAALDGSNCAIARNFEWHLKDEEELALLNDALLEQQRAMEASQAQSAGRAAEYGAALGLGAAMQDGERALQAAVHRLQGAVQRRRRVAAEEEEQRTAREEAQREREAQREERDAVRAEAAAVHERVRAIPAAPGWQEQRSLAPSDVAKQVAYLAAWRAPGGRRPAAKPKGPK
eukprot:EG_transcript_17186